MKQWQRLGYGKKRQVFLQKLPSIQFIKHVKSTEVMRNKAFISHIAVKIKQVIQHNLEKPCPVINISSQWLHQKLTE
jgi:hypothetical protein